MPNVSVHPILWKYKLRSDGTCEVRIRITHKRKSRYLRTGVYIGPKDWNNIKREVRKSHDLAESYNEQIKQKLLEATQAALDAPSADAVIHEVLGSAGNLTRYFQRYIEQLDMRGQYWESKKYRVTSNKVAAALGDELDFRDVDRQALSTFERYLRFERKNGANTIRKEMQRLRRIYRDAIRAGMIRLSDDPFLTYDRPKSEPTRRRKLTIKELRRIEAADLGEETALGHVRDAFVFSFYMGGTRISDICTLRPENISGGRLTYRMMKTGTPVSLPLHPKAARIAERHRRQDSTWLFPFLPDDLGEDPVLVRKRINSVNVIFNKQLKRVCELAEVEQPDTVTAHVARHSYADFARSKSGDLFAVSKSLGHKRLATTEIYLKSLDQDAVDRLSDQLWSDQ